MRLGMMQPYFFPYAGYFALILATDRWIVFDTAQYIRRGWINRNRVLSEGADGWKYIRVPVVSAPATTRICDMRIDHRDSWMAVLRRSLDAYQSRHAPFFRQVNAWLSRCGTEEPDVPGTSPDLTETLVHLLRRVCEYLEIPFRCERFSAMDLTLPEITAPGHWTLEVARAVGADTYINAPGGRALFDPQQFHDVGIRLRFLDPVPAEYDQGSHTFIPGLSIIDLMMWNSPARVRELVSQYDLKPA